MPSETSFIRRLLESGRLSADEVDRFRKAGHTEQLSREQAERLARDLLAQGRFTPFQSTTLHQNKKLRLVLGNYVLLDIIGQGGMGTVFKAEHRRMKRQVALKIMSGAGLQSPEAVERFHREVEVIARLNHPNIVAAYDADEIEGAHFLVMELVEGSDLAHLVRQQGPLEVTQAVQYILQAARGLEYAHAAGIVHRDIKPHNLMLDETGTVKVLDMGLARLTGSDPDLKDESLTKSDGTMGTADYMAPEQALSAKTADQRADIYSLGCALHYLIVGTPVYAGDARLQKLLAHREHPIPSLTARRTEVSSRLDEVFRKMVAKKLADRYQSMSDVIHDLEAILAEMSSEAHSSNGRDLVPPTVPGARLAIDVSPPKRWGPKWAPLGSSAAAAALLGLVIWSWICDATKNDGSAQSSDTLVRSVPTGLGAADRKLIRFRCLNCTHDSDLKLVMKKYASESHDEEELSLTNLGESIETNLVVHKSIEIAVESQLGTYFFSLERHGVNVDTYRDEMGNAIPKNLFQHAYVTLRLSTDLFHPGRYKWEFEETNDENADEACLCPKSEDGV